MPADPVTCVRILFIRTVDQPIERVTIQSIQALDCSSQYVAPAQASRSRALLPGEPRTEARGAGGAEIVGIKT